AQATAAAEAAAAPFEIPPPSEAGKANIGGTLLRMLPEGGTEPIQDAVIYLGEVVYDSEGRKIAAGMFQRTSPRTPTDIGGHFLFENVEPGEYGLFFWRPTGSLLLSDPETGDDMLFTLEPGSAINTGVLEYDLPQ
ncbi:MAG: hypothetical protein ACRDIB_15760, partial [Ardenticatenaceae bacterium]